MCQVHTGAYVSLLAPGKTDYSSIPLAPRERLPCTPLLYIYIARGTYRYAYARQTHINWKKEATKETKKRRKENKIKGRYHLPACLAVVGQLIGKKKQRKKQREEEKKIR